MFHSDLRFDLRSVTAWSVIHAVTKRTVKALCFYPFFLL